MIKADDTDVRQRFGTLPHVFPSGFDPKRGVGIIAPRLHEQRLRSFAVRAKRDSVSGKGNQSAVNSASFEEERCSLRNRRGHFPGQEQRVVGLDRRFGRETVVFVVSVLFGDIISSARHAVGIKLPCVGCIQNDFFHLLRDRVHTAADSVVGKVFRLVVKSGHVILITRAGKDILGTVVFFGQHKISPFRSPKNSALRTLPPRGEVWEGRKPVYVFDVYAFCKEGSMMITTAFLSPQYLEIASAAP